MLRMVFIRENESEGLLMLLLRLIFCVLIISGMVGVIAGLVDIGQNNAHKPYGLYERWAKRPLDAFVATGALIVLSPVMLIIALLVRIKLGSPVLFTQDRPGKDEKIFRLYKFRTMTDERDKNGELLPNDRRLNKFGRILRKTSLDELPELINIVIGDMSIVGPRPLLPEYIPYYTEEEHHRHDVRPGLTGLAQVNGRNAIGSWEERFGCDHQYVKECSFLLDAGIIWKTVIKVVKRADVLDGNSTVVGRLDEVRKKIEN